MKFENPIMNISKFEVENIVTESVPVTENLAVSEAVAALNGGTTEKKVVTIMY